MDLRTSIILLRKLNLLKINRSPGLVLQIRGFKSPNKLHHNKSNQIPFYTRVNQAINIVFPIFFFFLLYEMEYPESFVKSFFGFDQIKDKLEEDKDESVRKRKKVKRYLDLNTT